MLYWDSVVLVSIMLKTGDSVLCWPESLGTIPRLGGQCGVQTITCLVNVWSVASNHRSKKMVPGQAVNGHVRMLVMLPCEQYKTE